MTKEERFSYPSADGKTTIDAVRWIPENGKYDAILQISHGMIEFIDRYKPFAEYLNDQGFYVVGHTHLGHGNSVTSQENWGFIADEAPSDKMITDMHTLRTMIQKENPGVPYFMLAHSMGSYLLRKYLTIYPDHLSGAILVGTGCVSDVVSRTGMAVCKVMAKFYGWHHRSKMLDKLVFSGPYNKFDKAGAVPENSWLNKDVECVKSYYADPRCTFHFTLNGYYALMETVYYDNQKENIRKTPKTLPLFLVSGKDDPVGNLGAGVKKVFDLYQEAGLEDLTYKLYENDRHEILNETDKEQVYADIASWMKIRIL